MQELTQVIRHPLLLLFVGAIVSGLIVPRLTQRWQDHRKALDVKADLVERVSAAVISMFTAVQFSEVGADSQIQADFDEAYRDWQKDKNVLTALIGVYFSSSSVLASWTRCMALTTAYYTQVGINDEARKIRYLGSVMVGVMATPPVDRSEEFREDSDVTIDKSALGSARLRSQIYEYLNLTVQSVNEADVSFGRRARRRRVAWWARSSQP